MTECRAYKCECSEYSHEKKIGDYDTCICTHTRNTHSQGESK